MGTPIDVNGLNAFNLAGVRGYTASQGSWPTGGYECVIVGLRTEMAESGGAMFVVTLQARAGKLALTPENAEHSYERDVHGKTMLKWVTIPDTAPTPEKNEHYRGGMRGFLESLGLTPAQIDQNLRPAEVAAFVMGRVCNVWVIETTTTDQGDSSWMTPDQMKSFAAGAWSGKTAGKPRKDAAGAAGGGAVTMPTIGQQSANQLAALAAQSAAPAQAAGTAFSPTAPAPLGGPIAPGGGANGLGGPVAGPSALGAMGAALGR